ncbi:Gag polyprotein [Bienertia sinuspersici]
MRDFCYFCGKLGHFDQDCDDINGGKYEIKEVVYRYGPWMRPPSLARRALFQESQKHDADMDKQKEVGVETQIVELLLNSMRGELTCTMNDNIHAKKTTGEHAIVNQVPQEELKK